MNPSDLEWLLSQYYSNQESQRDRDSARATKLEQNPNKTGEYYHAILTDNGRSVAVKLEGTAFQNVHLVNPSSALRRDRPHTLEILPTARLSMH